jgi:hypothetical protein
MFSVTESEIATIQAALESSGELGAAVELRRLFPGIGDIAQARRCVQIIATWKPVQPQPKIDS